MIPVEISKAADADLARILEYGWDHFGEAAATAYLRSFNDALTTIAEHPLAGALHDTVTPAIRSLPHGSHRIYYDVLKERVVIRRVLHKSMDAVRHLLVPARIPSSTSAMGGKPQRLLMVCSWPGVFEGLGESPSNLLESVR